MNIDIFDQYNIRARISVYIIVLCPLIVTIYLTFEDLRNIGSSVMLLFILFSFANYFFIVQRYYKKKEPLENCAVKMLYHSDNRISADTKERYYRTLSLIDKQFTPLLSTTDNSEFKKACIEAISWLRNNSRNNHLVYEENILYGFINNAINAKKSSYIILIISGAIQILLIVFDVLTPSNELYIQNILLIFTIDLLLLCFWTLGITTKKKDFVAEKYSIALLGTIDTLSTQNKDSNKA